MPKEMPNMLPQDINKNLVDANPRKQKSVEAPTGHSDEELLNLVENKMEEKWKDRLKRIARKARRKQAVAEKAKPSEAEKDELEEIKMKAEFGAGLQARHYNRTRYLAEELGMTLDEAIERVKKEEAQGKRKKYSGSADLIVERDGTVGKRNLNDRR